jgi:hypothetical protein
MEEKGVTMPYKQRSKKHAWNKRYYSLHPERYKAEQAVRTAKRNGTLTPMPCVVCGALKAEAHHKDYSRPLDVVWLCKRCNRLVHNGKIDI